MKIRSAIPAVTVDSMMRKVASVFVHHRIPSGEPADLDDLLQALQRDKHLAMNFWAAVRELSDDHGAASSPESSPDPAHEAPSGRILQEMTLEAIVRVTTGLTISEMRASGESSKQAVLRLANLLAGRDADCDTLVSDATVGLMAGIDTVKDSASPQGENYKNALLARLDETKRARRKRGANLVSIGNPLPGTIALRSEQADPTPNPSGLLLPATPAAEEFTAGKVISPLPRKGDEELRRLLFGPAYTNQSDSVVDQPVRLRMPMWLRIWLQMWQPVVPPVRKSPSKGLMARYGVLLLTVCAALFYAQRTGSIEYYAQRLGSLISANADPDSATAAEMGNGSNRSRSAEAALTSAAKRRKVGAPRLKLASIVEDSRTPPEIQTNDLGPMSVSIRDASTRSDGPESFSIVGSANPIAVPEDVMKADLISSPDIEYSGAPATSQMGGRVVMRAVISQNGFIEDLQPVEGDPALQAAAIRTVSTWRYRPYLVAGEPVKVVTTVTVHFKLDY